MKEYGSVFFIPFFFQKRMWYLIPGTTNTQGKTMNRLICYVTITNDEMKIVDRIAEKIGYASRTELVTALLIEEG